MIPHRIQTTSQPAKPMTADQLLAEPSLTLWHQLDPDRKQQLSQHVAQLILRIRSHVHAREGHDESG